MDQRFLLLAIIALIAIPTCNSNHKTRYDQKKITQLETMLKDNSTTMGVLDDSYTEHQVKLKKLDVKVSSTYEFSYKYDVGGTRYNGNHTFASLPTNSLIKVYYLKENPEVHSLDPRAEIKDELNKKDSHLYLYLTVFWAIILVGSCVVMYRTYKANKILQQKINEAKRRQREEHKRNQF